MLAVSINDRPLDQAAIAQRGRILLPMRASLTGFGTISYDARSQTVSIVPAKAQRAAETAAVTALDPPANAAVATAYPTISASLAQASATPSRITLKIDEQDVTALASFDGSTITFMPRTGLARGSHTVTFSGKTKSGQPFSETWSFATTLAAPADAAANSYEGYDYRFYVNGSNAFYPGDWMHFVLLAPPGGSAMLRMCGLGYQYAFWNGGYGGTYQASVLAPFGYQLPYCRVTAIYTSWTGVSTVVPIPVFVDLFTQPRLGPAPQPTGRPLPTSPRKTEPTPTPLRTPLPLRTPAPVQTYHPVHGPVQLPIHVPVPRPRRTP